MNIGLIIYILNSINSIMRFLERRDYTYWTHKIHSKFKIYTHLTLINTGGGAQSSSSIGESRFLRNGTSNEPETGL